MKRHFPVFAASGDKPVPVYLDSAATAQVPQSVLDAVVAHHVAGHANIHRGVHFLGERASAAFEGCRKKTARFINAPPGSHVIFTSGTTQAVNTVAGFFAQCLAPGDVIAVSRLEHHSNLLPWIKAATAAGAAVVPFPLSDDLRIDPDLIPFDDPRVKLLVITHVSNLTGGIQPVAEICRRANHNGIPVFVDGAQAVAHIPIDVQAIGADYYAFSAHKMYGVTGTGVLYASALPDHAEPMLTGGGMVAAVAYDGFVPLPAPQKFEGGTPNIAGVVGLSAAVDFMQTHAIGQNRSEQQRILRLITDSLEALGGFDLFYDALDNAGIVSFSHPEIHPHDLAAMLSQKNVCIRAGHHCVKPLLQFVGQKAACRVSLGCYNDESDARAFIQALQETLTFFEE